MEPAYRQAAWQGESYIHVPKMIVKHFCMP